MKNVIAVIAALWIGMYVVFSTACDDSPTGVQATDTVYVYKDKQVWGGAQVRWTDQILNNDVQAKIRAGWECDLVFTLPYWLPLNAEQSAFALTMVELYICTSDDPYASSASMTAQDFTYDNLNLVPGAPVPDFKPMPFGN